MLGVLRALTRSGPLLLAVDDVHLLDPVSRSVLSFALRRLRDEPVGLLSSRRMDLLPEGFDAADLGLASERLVVGPLSVGTLHRIITSRLGNTLSRPHTHPAPPGHRRKPLDVPGDGPHDAAASERAGS